MEKINLTDVVVGEPKTIAVNYVYNKKPYKLPTWTCELIIFDSENCMLNKDKFTYTPLTKEDEDAVFYLSSEETTKLGQLAKTYTTQSVINENKNPHLNYEIYLVKDTTVTKRKFTADDEVKIGLCYGDINFIGDELCKI